MNTSTGPVPIVSDSGPPHRQPADHTGDDIDAIPTVFVRKHQVQLSAIVLQHVRKPKRPTNEIIAIALAIAGASGVVLVILTCIVFHRSVAFSAAISAIPVALLLAPVPGYLKRRRRHH